MDIRKTPFWNLLLVSALASSGGLVEDSASGNPVVFETEVAKPLRKLSISLLPQQEGSGDPSPENVRDLIPWGKIGTWTGGKNLAKLVYGNKVPSTSTGQMVDYNGWVTDFVRVDHTKKYFVSGVTSLTYAFYYAIDGTYLGNASHNNNFELSAVNIFQNTAYIKLRNDSPESAVLNIQLEAGETATAYETPNITPHPVNLQKNLCPVTEINDIGWVVRQDAILAEINKLPSGDYVISYTSTLNSLNEGMEDERWGTGFIFTNPVANIQLQTYTNAPNPIGKTIHASKKFTITSEMAGKFTNAYSYGAGNNDIGTIGTGSLSEIQIESGSQETPFQPYIPPVYGCEIDTITGEVWKTYDSVDLGTFTYEIEQGSEGYFFVKYNALPNAKKVGNNTLSSYLCGIYKTVKGTEIYFGLSGDYAVSMVDSPDAGIRIRDDRFETASELKTALDGVILHYELATPVLLATLTPQQIESLIGTNTIWTDGDNVEVTFLKKK